MAFQFASQAYSVSRYGDLLTDFWQQYRSEVEAALHRMGLDQHLATIEQGLNSDNETGWRAGILACRSLLEDLAAHLWKDTLAPHTMRSQVMGLRDASPSQQTDT